ncbi:MAG TPA: pimeloyl-ACP methyl ester esterase BioH [Gammaproteobacteria bacterium]|nr:pimeloyl-ACP methyl ester esterase BioH [Gammaproteobacteria bacterium]
MTLWAETNGSGPDLVLVHGWGVNSGVWDSVLPLLTRRYRVTCVDLPGHGGSAATAMPASLDALAGQVAEIVPRSALWLGWSLGGLVCLRIATLVPERVVALMLSNTTPKFTRAADWPHAMPVTQLDAFATELAQDFAGTVKRFLSLQVLGDERARETLRALRDSVLSRGQPDVASLATGLGILRDSDLREQLHDIAIPTLVMTSPYDRLTPQAAGEYMANRIENAKPVSFPRTAHAPFISHPAGFLQAVNEFADTVLTHRVHAHAH